MKNFAKGLMLLGFVLIVRASYLVWKNRHATIPTPEPTDHELRRRLLRDSLERMNRKQP